MSCTENKITLSYVNTKTVYSSLVFALCILFSYASHAAGISLGATRVIYPQNSKEVSLQINNTSKKENFLIQSWVSTGDGSKSTSFVVTPPLFTMKPEKENILRIMYVGAALPTDRETVFYFNAKAIPSVDKSAMTGNNLQIATQSVIKLFIRPENLPDASSDAPKMLTCHISNGIMTIRNPSSYYVSLVQLRQKGSNLPSVMVSPKNLATVNLPNKNNAIVTFQTINDYGALTPEQSCSA